MKVVGLIVISFETRKGQEEILDQAVKYFRDDVGLEVTERGSCCVYFADKIGYVKMTLTEEEDKFKVDVESKEYEYHAKEFARKFK